MDVAKARALRKRGVDAAGVLSRLGAEGVSETDQGYQLCCLDPSHTDKHPSMVLNWSTLARGNTDWLWHCYSCGASGVGLADLVRLATWDLDGDEVEAILGANGQWTPSPPARAKPTETPTVVTKPLTDRHRSYLDGRGIPDWWMRKRKLRSYAGTSGAYLNSVVIPHVRGWWFIRTTIKNRKPPYLYPRGFPRSTTLYGLTRVRAVDQLVVVEGAFDCWKIELAGHACVAILGNRVTDAQMELLSEYRRLLVLPDTDQGGRKLAAQFRNRQGAKVVRLPKGDPGAYRPDQLRTLLR